MYPCELILINKLSVTVIISEDEYLNQKLLLIVYMNNKNKN